MDLGEDTSEVLLVGGLAAFAAVLLGAIALFLGGKAAGGVQRGRRRSQGPPSPGTVPAGRHRGTSSSTAR
jgi:hypothetical protein